MSPYRTQSPDTSRETEEVLFDLYRHLEPSEKLRIVWDLARAADERARIGIRERHPRASEREVELRLASLKYGRELMMKAFGWDPERMGW